MAITWKEAVDLAIVFISTYPLSKFTIWRNWSNRVSPPLTSMTQLSLFSNNSIISRCLPVFAWNISLVRPNEKHYESNISTHSTVLASFLAHIFIHFLLYKFTVWELNSVNLGNNMLLRRSRNCLMSGASKKFNKLKLNEVWSVAETWRRVWGGRKFFRGPRFLIEVFSEKISIFTAKIPRFSVSLLC